MRMIIALLMVASVLAGCATSHKPTIPYGYTGPRSSVNDTVKVYSNSKADLFYVSDVNGSKIDDALGSTRIKNQNHGFNMEAVALQHEIPVQLTTLNIVGRTEYAAPILAFTNTVYEVKGIVEFTPEPNKTYVVRGVLGENYSAVWVEDLGSGAVVGKKVEVNGSAALGFFQK